MTDKPERDDDAYSRAVAEDLGAGPRQAAR